MLDQQDVANYVSKMSFKDGDILFVDSDAVDVESLVHSFPIHSGRVSVCAVYVPIGRRLDDCIIKQVSQ